MMQGPLAATAYVAMHAMSHPGFHHGIAARGASAAQCTYSARRVSAANASNPADVRPGRTRFEIGPNTAPASGR
jgi:hypothetical protein